MQQAIIHISKPCHENWQQMTPTEKGKFCGACQKEVLDFTNMTDTELFTFFAKKSTGSICGRLHNSQLNTVITKPVILKKRRFWYFQYIVTLLLLFIRPSSNAKAQTQTLSITAPTRTIADTIKPAPKPMQEKKWVTGKVQDEDGDPIAFASINVKGTNNSVASDENGNFRLQVKNGDIINIYASSFASIGLFVRDKMNTNITLEPYSQMGVVQVTPIRNPDDFIGYDVPRHKTVLQISDKTDGNPIANASISVKRNGKRKIRQIQSDEAGQSLLDRIREDATYDVMVAASGYKSRTISIRGYQLNQRYHRTILLVKETATQ